MKRLLLILLSAAGLASAQVDLIVNDLSVDGRFRGQVNQVLAGEFDLAAQTIVTQTLLEPVTDYRWLHIIAGEDDINGLGLGVISVPLAEIPVATPTPQGILYGITIGRLANFNQNLYQLNRTTGTATAVGPMSTVQLGLDWSGLGEVSNQIYAWSSNIAPNGGLWAVNRMTGFSGASRRSLSRHCVSIRLGRYALRPRRR